MSKSSTSNRKYQIVGVAVPNDLVARVDELAHRNRVTRSKIFRLALQAFTSAPPPRAEEHTK